MTGSVLIDTDIIIDMGRNIKEAVDCVSNMAQKSIMAVSAVTYMELIVGCRNKKELIQLNQFISSFEIIRLNNQISDIASDLLHSYRLSHGLLIPDALIAATALFFECPLISKNQRDYRFIEELNLLPYPSN